MAWNAAVLPTIQKLRGGVVLGARNRRANWAGICLGAGSLGACPREAACPGAGIARLAGREQRAAPRGCNTHAEMRAALLLHLV